MRTIDQLMDEVERNMPDDVEHFAQWGELSIEEIDRLMDECDRRIADMYMDFLPDGLNLKHMYIRRGE